MIDAISTSPDVSDLASTHNFLSESDTAKLLFLSFRFSQGFPDLQKEIFIYLHREHPEWNVLENEKDVIIQSLQKKVRYVVGRHTHPQIVDDNISSELEIRFKQLATILNSTNTIDEHRPVCRTLITLMLQQDRKYLCLSGNKARPHLNPHVDANTFVDAHLSYICHFVIQGNPTGHPAFDTMCKDLRGMLLFLLQSKNDKEEYLSALDQIVCEHNEHHPERKVDLLSLLAEAKRAN